MDEESYGAVGAVSGDYPIGVGVSNHLCGPSSICRHPKSYLVGMGIAAYPEARSHGRRSDTSMVRNEPLSADEIE